MNAKNLLLLFAIAVTRLPLAIAQSDEPEPDPDLPVNLSQTTRNPDFIGPSARASVRAAIRDSTAAPSSKSVGAASGSTLSDHDLRYFAARGIGPTINVCSLVVTGGRGAAQAPVFMNTTTTINCQAPSVQLGR